MYQRNSQVQSMYREAERSYLKKHLEKVLITTNQCERRCSFLAALPGPPYKPIANVLFGFDGEPPSSRSYIVYI